MRLGFFTDNHPLLGGAGGIGTYVHVLSEALTKIGHTVHVFSPANSTLRLTPRPGLTIHGVALASGRRGLHARDAARFTWHGHDARLLVAFQLERALAAEVRATGAFDMLEVPEFAGLGVLALRHRHARVLSVRLHGDVRWTRTEGECSTPWAGLSSDPEEESLGRADVVVAPSPAVARRARSLWPTLAHRREIKVVPLPVRLPLLTARHPQREHTDLLLLGRLQHSKGIDVVARALGGLRRPVTVELLGQDTPWLDRTTSSSIVFRDLAGPQHDLRFLGLQPAHVVEDRLGSGALVVFASRRETFGLAAAEALAFGAPTLLPRSDAYSGLGLPPDWDGWYAAEDDEDLRRRITELLEDEDRRTKLSERGRAHASRWSPHLVAEECLRTWFEERTDDLSG